jgi:hypothetical protein
MLATTWEQYDFIFEVRDRENEGGQDRRAKLN